MAIFSFRRQAVLVLGITQIGAVQFRRGKTTTGAHVPLPSHAWGVPAKEVKKAAKKKVTFPSRHKSGTDRVLEIKSGERWEYENELNEKKPAYYTGEAVVSWEDDMPAANGLPAVLREEMEVDDLEDLHAAAKRLPSPTVGFEDDIENVPTTSGVENLENYLKASPEEDEFSRTIKELLDRNGDAETTASEASEIDEQPAAVQGHIDFFNARKIPSPYGGTYPTAKEIEAEKERPRSPTSVLDVEQWTVTEAAEAARLEKLEAEEAARLEKLKAEMELQKLLDQMAEQQQALEADLKVHTKLPFKTSKEAGIAAAVSASVSKGTPMAMATTTTSMKKPSHHSLLSQTARKMKFVPESRKVESPVVVEEPVFSVETCSKLVQKFFSRLGKNQEEIEALLSKRSDLNGAAKREVLEGIAKDLASVEAALPSRLSPDMIAMQFKAILDVEPSLSFSSDFIPKNFDF